MFSRKSMRSTTNLRPRHARLELLERRVVEDLVDLRRELLVDLGDQRVDERLVDLLALALRGEQLGDERLHALAWRRRSPRRRGSSCVSARISSRREPPSSVCVARRRRAWLLVGHRSASSFSSRGRARSMSLFALRRVAEDLLDLLAEGLLVAERALERRERRAQLEQLLELGHLVRDRLGLRSRRGGGT